MSEEQFRNEKIYHATMNIAKSLMEQGAMTAEEYGQIDTIFREKYRPILVSLQTEMSGYKAGSMASCEQAAAAALGLAAFDGDAVRREVSRIVINADRIEFRMKNGKAKEVMRAYQRGRSAFSQKITCGCCGRKLECDYWKMGPKGQKKKYKVWVCRGCSFRRLLDDDFREAVAEVLGREDCEPRFVKEVAGVTAYEDRFEFHFTDGEVAEWQRE